MEPKEILELVRAGFTKQDIALMIAPVSADPAGVQTSIPAEPAAPEAAAEAVPVAEPAAEPAAPATALPVPAGVAQLDPQQQPSTADIMREIARLTSAVQANAIANSTMPQGISNPVKAEDIVAQIIRPTYPERGN